MTRTKNDYYGMIKVTPKTLKVVYKDWEGKKPTIPVKEIMTSKFIKGLPKIEGNLYKDLIGSWWVRPEIRILTSDLNQAYHYKGKIIKIFNNRVSFEPESILKVKGKNLAFIESHKIV